jgi:uncharacterized ParB-like nuclease family protein
MKTLKQFLDEAETTKVTMFNRDLDNDEIETGATVSRYGRPMEREHSQDKVKMIPLNRTIRHETPEKTARNTATPESEKAVQGIMSDIKKKKDIEPILVRRKKGGTYQIMDGHHRLEAHLRMGLRHIPARVIDAKNVKYDGTEEK